MKSHSGITASFCVLNHRPVRADFLSIAYFWDEFPLFFAGKPKEPHDKAAKSGAATRTGNKNHALAIE
jgi:hypothetical protein